METRHTPGRRDRTADLDHPDDDYREWLHAQFTYDHAALRVKHPRYRRTPRRAKSPDLIPIPIATEPVTVHAEGPGWHGQSLSSPEGIGHFLIEGEVALSVSPQEIAVQLIFADEQDTPLFYFNLVPGVVKTRLGGYFLLERERARPVPERVGGHHDPQWAAVRKVVLRCASDHEGSATVLGLRVFARVEDGTIAYGNMQPA